MRTRAPKALLDQIKKVVPPSAEVVPLGFRYENEDYNIAVFVGRGSTVGASRIASAMRSLTRTILHRTTTLCYVWSKSQRQAIVAA